MITVKDLLEYHGKEILCLKDYDNIYKKGEYYCMYFYSKIPRIDMKSGFRINMFLPTFLNERLTGFKYGDVFFEHFEIITKPEVRQSKINSILDGKCN